MLGIVVIGLGGYAVFTHLIILSIMLADMIVPESNRFPMRP